MGPTSTYLTEADVRRYIMQLSMVTRKLLVENGAHVDAKIHGWTAMLLAAKNWLPRTAEYFVQHGADVNAGDYWERRALHWAAHNGGVPLAHLLLDSNADPNATDCWGRTPLVWAVERRRHKVITLLLQNGADVTLTAQDGSTALHMAAFEATQLVRVSELCVGDVSLS